MANGKRINPLALAIAIFCGLSLLSRAWAADSSTEPDCRFQLDAEIAGVHPISPTETNALISSALTVKFGLTCGVYAQVLTEALASYEGFISIERPLLPQAIEAARAGNLVAARDLYTAPNRQPNSDPIGLLDERAALTAAMSDFAGAAALYGEAARLEPNPINRQTFEIEEARQLHNAGDFYRDSDALMRALEVFRRLSLSIGRDDPRWPWLQASLANTVFSQADQTADTDAKLGLLVNAVVLYRSVSEVRQSMPTPDDWAQTQYNLGLALTDISARQSSDQALSGLRDACTALQNALSVYDLGQHGRIWANTKNALARALLARSAFEGPEAARGEIAQAQQQLQDVLATRSRELAPLDWASAQSVLAMSYSFSARIEENPNQKLALQRQAVAADRTYLSAVTMADGGTDWATVQTHLAETLLAIARVDDTPSLPQDSIDAAQNAQRVVTRASDPRAWGKLSIDVAFGHAMLVERGDRTHVAAAREAASAAGEAFETAHDDADAAFARRLTELLQQQ